ncbi:MAG: insulinase family protein [Ruminococcaceae bacterium]|nr:insulinase family protein [Oscillospiraceae bacterium]
MKQIRQIDLFDGATLLHYRTDRFKSTRITIRFALPAQAQSASARAALPGLLRYTSKEFPTTMQMERKLASLYGAGFSGISTIIGDTHVLSFTISTVADRFALAGECISRDCLHFLLACIFEPDLDANGLFKPENLQREQRLLIEDIQAGQSDKMTYSVHRFKELFYAGEGAAVKPNGTEQQVNHLTVAEVTAAWRQMLEKAQVFVLAIGDTDAQSIAAEVRGFFEKMQRNYEKPVMTKHLISPQLKQFHEEEALEQCKLNLGFCVDCENEHVFKVMNMIFGGSEMSKLSKSVREKMSLCYYCSSACALKKQTLLVFSGIEGINREKAIAAIRGQLEAMQSGNITQEEIDIAKRKIKDAYLSSLDTPVDIAQWYLPQMFDESILSVEESIAGIDAVTKEQVIACAKTAKLDTIYSLG